MLVRNGPPPLPTTTLIDIKVLVQFKLCMVNWGVGVGPFLKRIQGYFSPEVEYRVNKSCMPTPLAYMYIPADSSIKPHHNFI